MEVIQQHWATYEAYVAPYEKSIINYFDPENTFLTDVTQDWPLAKFSTAFAVVTAYLGFVLFGSLIMLGQKPIRFYGLSFAYNLVQMALCSYMCIEAFTLAYRNNYSLLPCNEISRTHPPIANLLWVFYASKVLDFMDTFFIVLGKKWKQLSFLHVYHHTTIFMFYWLNLRINYDGDVYMTIILNGAIHCVMYTYYFVTLHSKDIWWKKYLTMCQLIQFTCMLSQGSLILINQCDFPQRVNSMYLVYIGSLFILFMHFYMANYKTKKTKTA